MAHDFAMAEDQYMWSSLKDLCKDTISEVILIALVNNIVMLCHMT